MADTVQSDRVFKPTTNAAALLHHAIVTTADILAYLGHLAFATGDPPPQCDPKGRSNVAQADCATNGVTYGTPHT